MPKYIKKSLKKFNHPPPKWKQPTPFNSAPIHYSEKEEMVEQDTSQPLDKEGIRYIQSVIGMTLYYGQMLGCAIVVANNDIATQQTAATTNTKL